MTPDQIREHAEAVEAAATIKQRKDGAQCVAATMVARTAPDPGDPAAVPDPVPDDTWTVDQRLAFSQITRMDQQMVLMTTDQEVREAQTEALSLSAEAQQALAAAMRENTAAIASRVNIMLALLTGAYTASTLQAATAASAQKAVRGALLLADEIQRQATPAP